MKNITKVLTATVLTGAVTLAAGAADTTKVESYAHPSLFGQQVQEYSSGKASYLTGAKLAQPENKVGVVGKDNVLVDTWAKGMLNILKNNQGDTFNPKMPVLRSELAVILAESFAHLCEREKKILKMRFGLFGEEEKTQKEIADMLGISQSYISRLEKKIVSRLKKDISKLV